ncbi:hypothetical protein EIP91_010315 [Steccherinum ochraceum]|uniref:Uncharacterized protein n=1 Tax=Steccherinum ochraceum TaxID=92696 RepID=A0A4R0R639_9APHY|nr:hypothetical protein EIP91_010315 [Steccherinum ochraceum]
MVSKKGRKRSARKSGKHPAKPAQPRMSPLRDRLLHTVISLGRSGKYATRPIPIQEVREHLQNTDRKLGRTKDWTARDISLFNKALEQLQRMGHIEYDRYSSVRLLPDGRDVGVVVGRHIKMNSELYTSPDPDDNTFKTKVIIKQCGIEGGKPERLPNHILLARVRKYEAAAGQQAPPPPPLERWDSRCTIWSNDDVDMQEVDDILTPRAGSPVFGPPAPQLEPDDELPQLDFEAPPPAPFPSSPTHMRPHIPPLNAAASYPSPLSVPRPPPIRRVTSQRNANAVAGPSRLRPLRLSASPDPDDDGVPSFSMPEYEPAPLPALPSMSPPPSPPSPSPSTESELRSALAKSEARVAELEAKLASGKAKRAQVTQELNRYKQHTARLQEQLRAMAANAAGWADASLPEVELVESDDE